MKKLLFIALSTLLLAGCPSVPTQPPAPVEPIDKGTKPPEPEKPLPSEIVPTVPKIKTVNWSQTIDPLVTQIIKQPDLEEGKLLLVDLVKNETNTSLQTANATTALITALQQRAPLKIIPLTEVTKGMRALGMSEDDNLGMRSKTIGLGRYLSADYVLYSVINGTRESRVLAVQLMSVLSGEILWSGQSAIVEQ